MASDQSLFLGAGLGVLRKPDFDIALIDEASQITEPCALIPLVKGIKRAIIVGDQSVQESFVVCAYHLTLR
jgi:superfamily I DNA and/or RNA helicase